MNVALSTHNQLLRAQQKEKREKGKMGEKGDSTPDYLGTMLRQAQSTCQELQSDFSTIKDILRDCSQTLSRGTSKAVPAEDEDNWTDVSDEYSGEARSAGDADMAVEEKEDGPPQDGQSRPGSSSNQRQHMFQSGERQDYFLHNQLSDAECNSYIDEEWSGKGEEEWNEVEAAFVQEMEEWSDCTDSDSESSEDHHKPSTRNVKNSGVYSKMGPVRKDNQQGDKHIRYSTQFSEDYCPNCLKQRQDQLDSTNSDTRSKPTFQSHSSQTDSATYTSVQTKETQTNTVLFYIIIPQLNWNFFTGFSIKLFPFFWLGPI